MNPQSCDHFVLLGIDDADVIGSRIRDVDLVLLAVRRNACRF